MLSRFDAKWPLGAGLGHSRTDGRWEIENGSYGLAVSNLSSDDVEQFNNYVVTLDVQGGS